MGEFFILGNFFILLSILYFCRLQQLKKLYTGYIHLVHIQLVIFNICIFAYAHIHIVHAQFLLITRTHAMC